MAAPIDVIKTGVARAMVDIRIVCNALAHGHEEAISLRYAATLAMVFVTVNNNPVGSLKAWERLSCTAVDDALRNCVDHVKIDAVTAHTTRTWNREMRKYCPPGTLAAMDHYLHVVGRSCDLFFMQKRHTTNAIDISRFVFGSKPFNVKQLFWETQKN